MLNPMSALGQKQTWAPRRCRLYPQKRTVRRNARSPLSANSGHWFAYSITSSDRRVAIPMEPRVSPQQIRSA